MFTGREFDEESGLYYLRARYYSPSIGRFLQRDEWPEDITDPISFVNKYSYCNNNSINWIDPYGWDKQKPWWQKLNLYLIQVGDVMVTKYPYSLNMQNMFGITQNIAGAGSMVGYIPRGIGYSNSNIWQGGRIAYRWANQYGGGVKFMTAAKLGVGSISLGFASAIMTGYTVGATINAYYWGYLNYKQKYGQ